MQRNINNCVNFNLQYFVQNLESYMSVDVKKSVSERIKTVAAGLTEQANGQLCGNTYRRVCCKLKKRTKLILRIFFFKTCIYTEHQWCLPSLFYRTLGWSIGTDLCLYVE